MRKGEEEQRRITGCELVFDNNKKVLLGKKANSSSKVGGTERVTRIELQPEV
jgi:hypothetical protein